MESYRILKIFYEHFVLHALMVNLEKCEVLMGAMNRGGITVAAVCKYEACDSSFLQNKPLLIGYVTKQMKH